MAISGINAYQDFMSTRSVAKYDSTSKELGRDEFLHLLTTQLSRQDPLNPMSDQEFVAQLATFSSLEQQIKTNSTLEVVALAQAASTNAEAVSYVGKTVLARGDAVVVKNAGPQELQYSLNGAAKRVTISIFDTDGNLVRTIDCENMESGQHEVIWDGRNQDGRLVTAGNYRMTVSAEDTAGGRLETQTMTRGVVDGVSFANGYPELIIGSRRVSLADIVEVLNG